MYSKNKSYLNRSLTDVKLERIRKKCRERAKKRRVKLSGEQLQRKRENDQNNCQIMEDTKKFHDHMNAKVIETQIKQEDKIYEEEKQQQINTFQNVDIEMLDAKDNDILFLQEETPQNEDADEITEKFVQALSNNVECVKFLQIRGLVSACAYCPSCGSQMMLKPRSKNWVVWMCNKSSKSNGHRRTQALFRGSFMEGSRMQPTRMLTLVYYFSKNITDMEFLITNVTVNEKKISRKAITDVMFLCREVCLMWVYEHCDRQKLLGGDFPVEVVQVNHGDKDAQSCILVLFEHNPDGRGRFVIDVCSDNSKKSLVPFILKYVKDNAKIATNLLRKPFLSYVPLFRVDSYEKQLVFLNEMSELDSILDSAKSTIPRGQRSKDMTYIVGEFLYRRQVDLEGVDPFCHFLNALKQFYPC